MGVFFLFFVFICLLWVFLSTDIQFISLIASWDIELSRTEFLDFLVKELEPLINQGSQMKTCDPVETILLLEYDFPEISHSQLLNLVAYLKRKLCVNADHEPCVEPFEKRLSRRVFCGCFYLSHAHTHFPDKPTQDTCRLEELDFNCLSSILCVLLFVKLPLLLLVHNQIDHIVDASSFFDTRHFGEFPSNSEVYTFFLLLFICC